MRIITYAYDPGTHLVFSRFTVDGNTKGFAVPVLDFSGMKPENNFATFYDMQRFDHLGSSDWNQMVWTKKIGVAWKNLHRAFWGMKLLPMTRPERQEFEAVQRKIRLPKEQVA